VTVVIIDFSCDLQCNRRVNVVKRSEKGAVESRRGEEHGRGNRRRNQNDWTITIEAEARREEENKNT